MKVIIAEVKVNGDWINLKTNTGQEISVGLKDNKSGNTVNQKLKAAIEAANIGDEIEMEVKEWKNAKGETKFFGNEPKTGGGGKSFTPADKSFDAAKSAAIAVATLYQGKSPADMAGLPATFEKIHALIMSKVTPK